MKSVQVTCMAGFFGVLVIVFGVFVSSVAFVGDYGEPFSILNHNISELGERGVSELAWLFNASLILGGIGLIVFFGGLGHVYRRWPIYMISISGVVAVTGMLLTGLIPMYAGETTGLHMDAAQLFFYGGMFSSIIYTLFVLIDRRGYFSRWTLLASLLVVASFAAFIYLPRILYPGFTLEDYLVRLQGADRPRLWIPSLLEWIAMASAVLWIVVMAMDVCRQARKRLYNH